MNRRTALTVLQPGLEAAGMSTEQRANFRHLYLDIAWFGILSGSSVSFITIYLARIGANGFQIGLLSAIPAVVALLLALPAAWWLNRRPLDRAVYRSSVYFRLFYALWIPLPILFAPSAQTWGLLVFTLLMSIPGTVLAVGFNALFAEIVPVEWRGHVAGIRNSILALTTVGSSLVSGFILSQLPFPVNYQIVFGTGLLGAAMSSYHLHRLRLPPAEESHVSSGRSLGDFAQPGFVRSAGESVRTTTGLRFLTRMKDLRPPRFTILQGAFGRVWLAFFIFHLALYLSIPLYPIYWVDEIGLPDSVLSLGNALFYASVLLGSTRIARLLRRFGNHRVTVLGAAAMVLYPGLTSITHTVGMYLVVNTVSGFAASLTNSAMPNHILDRIPADDRPSHLAWINLAINAAILAGSVVGPLVAGHLGLSTALALFAAARLVAAIAVWRWG
jgi:MFS family permease